MKDQTLAIMNHMISLSSIIMSNLTSGHISHIWFLLAIITYIFSIIKLNKLGN